MSRKSFVALFFCAICGCTSISSTLVNRTDSDVFIGNSDGKPSSHESATPYKGVPITLRVPTHLDVAIKESIWLDKSGTTICYVKATNRHLFVETKLVETDKVFTVDVKRPAAGTLTYTLGFGDNDPAKNLDNSQYFKSIAASIVDTTINDVNTSLQTLLPTIQKLAAKPTGAGDNIENLIEENRVVAWKRFDLDAPDFEAQVACFVELHLNACNSCKQYNAKP